MMDCFSVVTPEGACCAISRRSLKDVMAGFWVTVTTLDANYYGFLERMFCSALRPAFTWVVDTSKTLCDYKTSMV